MYPFRYLFSRNKSLVSSLKNLTGVYPHNLAVYKLALSHRSVARDTGMGIKLSNERLEYLGDAVLGAVIADLLFKRFPYKEEGFLTEMRSRIVSRESLKSLAVKMGLDNMVFKNAVRGSFKSMYGDALEALIGALYIDRGYVTTQKFIVERMVNLHLDLNEIETTENNFKSKLLNWAQREKHKVNFEIIGDRRHSRTIRVRLLVDGKEVARGQEQSKKKAEQVAAEAACAQLGILDSAPALPAQRS